MATFAQHIHIRLTGENQHQKRESPHLALTEALAAVGVVGSAVSRSPKGGLSEERRAKIRELARELVEL